MTPKDFLIGLYGARLALELIRHAKRADRAFRRTYWLTLRARPNAKHRRRAKYWLAVWEQIDRRRIKIDPIHPE